MKILLTYDIANTKNRTKLSNLLEGYRYRVNYSVFELDIKKYQLDLLLKEIEPFYDKEDSVRIYAFSADMIVEIFRQLVVDREIISILNHGTKLSSNKGRLTQESIKVITQNIQERLATPTKWRKGKYKLLTIIDEQALELSHVIKGIKPNFKGFVGRF
jgi:CRISPR-associated endonuclease Cas2